MTVNDDAIQNEMENVIANVEPSFIEKIVNNENLKEILCDGGIVGGWLCIGVLGHKVYRNHVKPWAKKRITAFGEWIDSKKKAKEQTNPVDDLKKVVEAEVVDK